MKREKFQQLSMPVVEVFLSIEEEIMMNIAKRLRKHDSLLTTDGIQSWQLELLKELGALRQENIRIIAQHAQMTVEQVSKMLKTAGYTTVKTQEGVMKKAVVAGVLMFNPPKIEVSPVIEAIMSQYLESAKESFNLINATMLNQADQAFTDVLNKTVGKVLAGVSTPQEALRETIREWVNPPGKSGGIPALIDKGGKEWSPEAYVSTVTRSMCNNIANDMQDARMDEYGVDHIEVSSHIGARPKCFPYQGKVYSRSGNDPNYPAFSETSYGEPAGLFGVNCNHVKYPFIPGISEQRYPEYDEDKNKRVYENSQKQRYLERQIRKAKRELAVFKEIGDEVGAKRANKKVREPQANLRQFINKTGRTRRRGREQLY